MLSIALCKVPWQINLQNADMALLLVADEAMLKLLDWTERAGCVDHDIHKALHWAFSGGGSWDPQVANDLYIAVESVRNGWSYIMKEFPAWLLRLVRFVEEDFDGEALWTALGVPFYYVEHLTRLKLRFEDGVLKIDKALEAEDDIFENVSAILLYLRRLKTFNEKTKIRTF